MVSALLSAQELDPALTSDVSPEIAHGWFLPGTAPVDQGVFARARRAASGAWQQQWVETPVTIAPTAPQMALSEVLNAWRASERDLAGMTGDGPEQELLEADVAMLGAMYQRLYSERLGR